MEQNEQHILSIENLKKVTATAIESVDSFSPSQLTLSFGGGKITICGNGMKITAFSKSTGSFSASGNIQSVKYAEKGMGIKQKLFK